MKLSIKTPKKALVEFIKQRPLESERDRFKSQLTILLEKMDAVDKLPKDESEEHLKNYVRDFLLKSYYEGVNEVNTKKNEDLVIYNGKVGENVAVIIEAKRPSNKGEMISIDNVNKRAFHEIILYYFNERYIDKNVLLKRLVITNIQEWYIIDANVFDSKIYTNPKIKQLYKILKDESKSNPWFYDELSKIIPEIDIEIPCVQFNLLDYKKHLTNQTEAGDLNLIALYKILSPLYLLKKKNQNDGNALNENFYKELLHIIGLEENKKGLIGRKEKNPNPASLIELIIDKLKSEDVLRNINDIDSYGEEKDTQYFNIALELCITWINRILFLKLLEGQLVAYHQEDKYKFLSHENIEDYDELYNLFHNVLAKTKDERDDEAKEKYSHVPYLNSSLFEFSDLEKVTIKIHALANRKYLDLYINSVLKDKKKGEDKLLSLDYLFKFLGAYDFASEGSENWQKDNKQLINASVLGKVFEKINGYKEGSIYTPAFITMYMCEQSIQLAVVQKFNDAFSSNKEKMFETFEHVKNYVFNHSIKNSDILKFNEIINSLRICDPAVGSGHFLVSALNKIIEIKAILNLLVDDNGTRIGGYEINIINDELIITDQLGSDTKYRIVNGKPITTAAQVLQKTIFREKQTIIENCLFGVDINPKSVLICRLRLWIELLKNTYYKEPDFKELETLPNIDINIKCGNSLMSRFALDSDLSKALRSIKYNIKDYRGFVNDYKNAKSRDFKYGLQKIIEGIKGDFKTNIYLQDPNRQRLITKKDEKNNLENQSLLFPETKQQTATRKLKIKVLENEIEKLTELVDEIKSNAAYKHSFEWRFEFPEVLNNNGDFEGFDAIIGNPPYMRIQEIERTQPLQKLVYEMTYISTKGAYDLANLFFELAVNISKETAKNAFIFPHKFLNSDSGASFRNYLMDGGYIDKLAHFGANIVFDKADTYPCIAFFSKERNNGIYFQRFPFKSDYKELIFKEENFRFLSYESINNASMLYGSNNWILFDNEKGFRVFEKIYQQKAKIETKFEEIFQGLATSKDDIYVLDLIDEEDKIYRVNVPLDNNVIEVEKDFFKPFLMGKEVQRYAELKPKRVVFFPYQINKQLELISEIELKEKFPLTYSYIKSYEKEFKARESGKAGKMKCWYAYIYPKNLNKFEQHKLSSMEICSNKPNVSLNENNSYTSTTVYSWIKKKDVIEDYRYFLAIANSNLIWWYLKNTGDTLQGDARRFKTNYLNPFPLPDNSSLKQQEDIVKLVDRLMEAKKIGIDRFDIENEIDEKVYELYNLTKEEIDVIEGKEHKTFIEDESGDEISIDTTSLMPRKIKGYSAFIPDVFEVTHTVLPVGMFRTTLKSGGILNVHGEIKKPTKEQWNELYKILQTEKGYTKPENILQVDGNTISLNISFGGIKIQKSGDISEGGREILDWIKRL